MSHIHLNDSSLNNKSSKLVSSLSKGIKST